MKLTSAARSVLLLLNRLPGGIAIGRGMYRLALRLSVHLLRRPGIAAFYVKGSAGRGNAVPGLSDIDLHAIVEDLDDDRAAAFARGFTLRLRRLKRWIPILNAYVDTAKDLEVAVRSGAPYYSAPDEDWTRVAGRRSLPARRPPPGTWELAGLKLMVRRFFGGQCRYVNRDLDYRVGTHVKVNENLLRTAARLAVRLKTDRVPPPSATLEELAEEAGDPHLNGLVRLQEKVKADGYRVSVGNDHVSTLFHKWFGFLRNVARRLDPARFGAGLDPQAYRPTAHALPPQTRATAWTGFAPLFKELEERTAGEKVAVVLSSVPCWNYGHRIYAVMRDDATVDEVERVRRAIHAAYGKHRQTAPLSLLGSFWSPLIVSEGMVRQISLFERGGLEPAYFRKHGRTVFNTLGRPLPAMEETGFLPSLLIECIGHLGFVRRRRDLPRPEAKFKTAFMDHVAGTLPAARLLLDRKVLVTTPAEAFREYLDGVGGEYGRFLESFHAEFAGRPPESVDERRLVAVYRRNWKLLKREADAITELYRQHLDARDSRIART